MQLTGVVWKSKTNMARDAGSARSEKFGARPAAPKELKRLLHHSQHLSFYDQS